MIKKVPVEQESSLFMGGTNLYSGQIQFLYLSIWIESKSNVWDSFVVFTLYS